MTNDELRALIKRQDQICLEFYRTMEHMRAIEKELERLSMNLRKFFGRTIAQPNETIRPMGVISANRPNDT